MRRLALLFLAWLALLLALPFAVAACFEAAHLGSALGAIERSHIDAASQFVRAFTAEHARFPDGEAFDAWARAMDAHGYAYAGRGFSLDRECAQVDADFCLGFRNSDVWVTYRSGQPDKNVARIDGRGSDALAHAGVMLFLAAVAAGFFVLARRATLRPRP
jgi:hypothetical protein